MPTLDEAIRFIAEFARHPRKTDFGSYGYDIYLPIIIHTYRKEIEKPINPGHQYLADTPEGRAMSVTFGDAAWELCRRGILRPGVRDIGGQGVDKGGYSVTASGRHWLEHAHDEAFIPIEPGRFAQIIDGFREKLGDGYAQRAQEASRCHFATAYLACCAMSGAAAESILLKTAIAKTGDEEGVLKKYRSAMGRQAVENIVVDQLKKHLADKFRNLMDLLKYWRDEAAHGTTSEITEFEAYEAMSKLLRLAHFAQDHWDELTAEANPGRNA